MDNILGNNIKFLRKTKNLTQDQLADKLGVKRAMIGSYEEGRAIPKLSTIQFMSHYFQVTIDSLVNTDLSSTNRNENEKPEKSLQNKELRILTTVINKENKELITVVPQKASAGYTSGYADPDFIESLPHLDFSLPEMHKERTYRAFQIKGDSMEPVPSGSYILGEFVADYKSLKQGKCYIIITSEDGIVFKRLFENDETTFLLKSDNPAYHPYTIEKNQVIEIWKAVGYVSFTIPEPDEISLQKLNYLMLEMRKEIDGLKKH